MNKKLFLKLLYKFFAKNLFFEFQRGIYKEYITQKENLTTLKGRYLINENLKYNFTKNRIYCEYDDFSENNVLNQFFLFAIKRFLRYAKNRKLLKQCELILDEVESQNIDINKLNIHFNRLNLRFKKSFEIAILLLNKFVPLFEKDKQSFAFLFDMSEVFEKFIGRIYKEIDSSAEPQKESNFGNLKLKPDIYTKELIIDTKYKLVKNREDLKTSDKYQMYVYGNNFEVKNTMLLYPEHLKKVDENLELGENDKMINLKMRSIDLNFDGNYEDFIKKMKKRVEEII